jgi:hypothetical protein
MGFSISKGFIYFLLHNKKVSEAWLVGDNLVLRDSGPYEFYLYIGSHLILSDSVDTYIFSIARATNLTLINISHA